MLTQFPELSIEIIRAAHKRIKPYIHRTPVHSCSTLDEGSGAAVLLKCENFQKVGAFKARGACNNVFSLEGEALEKGVVTHSSGNHAQALAYAASLRKVPAHIVMPKDTVQVKVDAVRGYGGTVYFCEPIDEERERLAAQVQDETGAVFIHPNDSYKTMAGQGTAVVELLEEHPDLEVVITPLGGGGLLGGTVVAAKGINPEIKVYGVKPEAGPRSVADGLRVGHGAENLKVIDAFVDDLFSVSEDEILKALRFTLERTKLVVEPSSATVIAALLNKELPVQGKKVGVIMSGGNLDLTSTRFQ